MTENSRAFVDSNVWLYNFISAQDVQKSQKSKNLIKENKFNICLSTQVINEVCFNLIKKENFAEIQIKQIIDRFYFDYKIAELDEKILLLASDLRARYPFSFWDGLIVASALSADTKVLYSEDMLNNLAVENKLKIINPFV